MQLLVRQNQPCDEFLFFRKKVSSGFLSWLTLTLLYGTRFMPVFSNHAFSLGFGAVVSYRNFGKYWFNVSYTVTVVVASKRLIRTIYFANDIITMKMVSEDIKLRKYLAFWGLNRLISSFCIPLVFFPIFFRWWWEEVGTVFSYLAFQRQEELRMHGYEKRVASYPKDQREGRKL